MPAAQPMSFCSAESRDWRKNGRDRRSAFSIIMTAAAARDGKSSFAYPGGGQTALPPPKRR